jgi:hypothetical protein
LGGEYGGGWSRGISVKTICGFSVFDDLVFMVGGLRGVEGSPGELMIGGFSLRVVVVPSAGLDATDDGPGTTLAL